MKKWYEMKMISATEAEISIFDEIGIWGVSVDQFKRDFDAVKDSASIRLLLNSPGGSVFDGMAMYSLLASVRSKLTVEVIGLAASMASIIALAGNELIMCEGTYYMIHNPTTVAWGDSEELKKVADVLETLKAEAIKIYAAHSKLDPDELGQLMSEETWLTADQAVEKGFATSVKKTARIAACAQFSAKFKQLPTMLLTPSPDALVDPQNSDKTALDGGGTEEKEEEVPMDPKNLTPGKPEGDNPVMDQAAMVAAMTTAVMASIPAGRQTPGQSEGEVIPEDFKEYLVSHGRTQPKATAIKTSDGFGIPTNIEAEIFKRRDLGSFFRRSDLGYEPARIKNFTGDTKITTRLSSTEAQYVAEGADYVDDTEKGTPVTLEAYKAGSIFSATEEAVEDSVHDIIADFSDEVARKLNKTENKKFLTGTGNDEPQGIITGGTAAVVAASTSAITLQELIDLDESLPDEYNDGAVYFVSKAFIKAVRGMKGTDGHPILTTVFGGRGALLFNRPVVRNTGMDGFGANKIPAVLAYLPAYCIGDRKIGGSKLKVRISENTKNGNTEMRWAVRHDGKVLDAEAFQYLKMASS